MKRITVANLVFALTLLLQACQSEEADGPCVCTPEVISGGKFRLSYPCTPGPDDVWAGCLFSVPPDGEFVHLHGGEMIVTDRKSVLLSGEVRLNVAHTSHELVNTAHMVLPEDTVQARIDRDLFVIRSEVGSTLVLTCEESQSPSCVPDVLTLMEGELVAIREDGAVECVEDPFQNRECEIPEGEGGCSVASSHAGGGLILLVCMLCVFVWIRRRKGF